ncbi:conserved hypothetical protein [Leishmania major strain Friedlin]|uniref:Uncharacterized protein n=1 Tax=Leishmania major TaxID=5664 RepID=Q4QA69_LEIMA|nr:conserved hypothetical protein [Leishmania major strain Friedlin]CAG9575035.1 hypothetical_protein_-_conserved [Leishmania major strain Friedlin]CAJ04548.1 conserved hypothetical protein [Leishmania major strain Friedlin]|eukprot:XP_001683779.1 conserved hypothetical protein [Leishmania major strain Friedlin]
MIRPQGEHAVSGDSAAAQGRFKRQREREAEAKRQEQRTEDVLAHTTHIVDTIASINGKYVLSLNGERARLAHQVTELQKRLTKHQLQHAEDTTQRVLSDLARLRGAVTSGVKDQLIESLLVEAERGRGYAFDAVCAHVDEALHGSLAVAEAELSSERQLNRTLVQQLKSYAQTMLREVTVATSRAFKAEVEVMQRDVLVAKLRAACTFAENRLVRHEQEVDALMRVVAQLAEKSRYAESARADVRRAKHHVRLLEQHLGLNEIVAAVRAEVARASSAAYAEMQRGSAPPAPPDPSLRSSAPHYYALKMLEHKEMTLTDLVDSWQQQESRIMEAEQRYTCLEGVVKRVQHDALVVHQRYLEEKQRREIADRRITDMVRERLHPQNDPAISQEVQRLRWAYTEVVDDAAQLAVNLKVCRDELRRAQEDAACLSAQVLQLQRDAEMDQVALAIQELRSEYTARVRVLEEASTRAEMQLRLAQSVSTQYGAAATEATAALQRAAQANAELSKAALQVVPDDRGSVARSNAAWREDVERIEKQSENVLAMIKLMAGFESSQGNLYDAQVKELMRQWTLAREAEKEAMASSAAADGLHSAGGLMAVSREAVDDGTESCTLVSSSIAAEESMDKMNAVLGASQFALREALVLLNTSLQSTDVERSHLVDASLSDAQCVSELMAEVRRVTAERDRLRAQVKVCQELLEKNHVTVVERALMHDVPVEDSLNVAEATERIEVLKNQLAAAKQVCERSLNEVKQVTAEKDDVELRLTQLKREHEVLQGHSSRLKDKLHRSLARESELMEKNMALQTQLTDLVQPPGAPAQEAEASSTALQTTATHLTELFSSLQESLGTLNAEIIALRRVRVDDASIDADVGSGGNTGAGAEDTEDTLLVDSLSRSGMMNIVRVLKDTLHKAGLLKASLRGFAGAQAIGLCAAAKVCESGAEGSGGAAAASIVPHPSPETQQRALEYRSSLLEAKLASMAAERLDMRERVQKAEKTTADMEAANQRLLTISKSMMEKHSMLKTENEQLRVQLLQLTATTNAASAPRPEPHAASSAPDMHAAEAPVSSQHVVLSATPAPTSSTSATQPSAPVARDGLPAANACMAESPAPSAQEQGEEEEEAERAPESAAANMAIVLPSAPMDEALVPETGSLTGSQT